MTSKLIRKEEGRVENQESELKVVEAGKASRLSPETVNKKHMWAE